MSKISCQDGVYLLESLEDVDLILTSPPYDTLRKVEFPDDVAEDMIEAAYEALKPGGTLVWVVADGHHKGGDTLTSFYHANMMDAVGFKVNVQIYRILNPKPNAQRKTPTKDFEYIFVGHKGRPATTNWPMVPSKYAGKTTSGSNGRRDGYQKADLRTIKETKRHTTTWEYTVGRSWSKDATPFPLELARDFIKMYSNPGEFVVDPMCGGGTTGVACVIEGRKFEGSDINQRRVAETTYAIADAENGFWPGADCPLCGSPEAVYIRNDGWWDTRCRCYVPVMDDDTGYVEYE